MYYAIILSSAHQPQLHIELREAAFPKILDMSCASVMAVVVVKGSMCMVFRFYKPAGDE